MDQFDIELHQSLYRETIGFKRRREAAQKNLLTPTHVEREIPFLIARLNLKALSYVMLLAMIFAALSVVVIGVRSFGYFNDELSKHSREVLVQVSNAKDLEILTREILSLERAQFLSELEKNRQSLSDEIAAKTEAFSQRAAALETLIGERSAMVYLTALQVSFAEWKRRHAEWSEKFSSGNPDLSYAVYDEEIGELRTRMFANAYALSASMEDLARSKLEGVKRGLGFFEYRMKIAAGFLFLVIAVFLWSLVVCLGGLADMFSWMKKRFWDLHFNTRKLAQESVLSVSPETPSERLNEMKSQVALVTLILEQVSEVFAAEWSRESEWKSERQKSYRELLLSEKILRYEKHQENARSRANIVQMKAAKEKLKNGSQIAGTDGKTTAPKNSSEEGKNARAQTSGSVQSDQLKVSPEAAPSDVNAAVETQNTTAKKKAVGE